MKLKISVRKVATSIGLAVCVLSGGLCPPLPRRQTPGFPTKSIGSTATKPARRGENLLFGPSLM